MLEAFEPFVGQRLARPPVVLSPVWKPLDREFHAVQARGTDEHGLRRVDDFRPDPVARNDSDRMSDHLEVRNRLSTGDTVTPPGLELGVAAGTPEHSLALPTMRAKPHIAIDW